MGKNTAKQKEFEKELDETRRVSASGLLKDLMQIAPSAIDFKKKLMKDLTEPTYLRLANANDILDRTLPKPTQQISMNAQVLQANMSRRELKEILMNRLARHGIVGDQE